MATELPRNSAVFTLADLVAHTGGVVTGSGAAPSPELRVEGVVTDSRRAIPGSLFVALHGERFDGHDHVAAAARAGAAVAVVEREVGDAGIPTLRVASTLEALGTLAAAHRARSPSRVIAVAGSAGKTTTRSAVGSALELVAPGAVHQTVGNLNNLIGVPLVLLGLRSEHRFLVVELGTNAEGEVERLARLARPDLAVLTLIGIEHSEGLGDLDGIEHEEGALFRALAPEGAAIGNADDARVMRQLDASSARKRSSYGFSAAASVRGIARQVVGVGRQKLEVETRSRRITLELPLVGEAGAYATLAALAVLEALELDVPDAARLSEAFAGAGEPGRLEPHELRDGTVVLDDAYNANPASAVASLRAAREVAASRKARLVLVIGEMRELGPVAAREHSRIGAEIGKSGAALLIAVAGDARLYVEPALAGGVEACFAVDAEAALAAARERVRPGDVVLVKASRGVRAERVVEGLLERGAA
jgi:UDP-N-acetylmuramoyl-tripeptide--D-alanyl-D-alanine ligase